MSHTIRIPVDVTNPGQFFACCGLLELAARLWRGSTAAFEPGVFVVDSSDLHATLHRLLESFTSAELPTGDEAGSSDDERNGDETDDELPSPISLGEPFHLSLDWWADKALKTWAGSMNAELIFKAMRMAIDPNHADPLNDLRVVTDPADSSKPGQKQEKREPFYFDSRRGGNAKSLDVGFAPDAFSMTSAACPAVEALCMVGLQRFRPMPTDQPRVFVYRAWTVPLPPCAAAAAACGLLPGVGGDLYRFENAFRTGKRMLKGFLPATRITKGDTP
ncbi:MAG: type I-U CRISPR-associated protein Cas8c [Phycisphaerae bacterium]|nr:type I-U CRISPR-associated protein Cas8c [Phycisphaerae bacterium]